jgi:hypothetical protein
MTEGQVTGDSVTHLDISWTSTPLRRAEDLSVDTLLELEPTELLGYACDCREDLRAVRLTLAEALALITSQQAQITRATRVIEFQRQQLRVMQRTAA